MYVNVCWHCSWMPPAECDAVREQLQPARALPVLPHIPAAAAQQPVHRRSAFPFHPLPPPLPLPYRLTPLPYDATVGSYYPGQLTYQDVDCTSDAWAGAGACTQTFCDRLSTAESDVSFVMSIPYIISAACSPPMVTLPYPSPPCSTLP